MQIIVLHNYMNYMPIECDSSSYIFGSKSQRNTFEFYWVATLYECLIRYQHWFSHSDNYERNNKLRFYRWRDLQWRTVLSWTYIAFNASINIQFVSAIIVYRKQYSIDTYLSMTDVRCAWWCIQWNMPTPTITRATYVLVYNATITT